MGVWVVAIVTSLVLPVTGLWASPAGLGERIRAQYKALLKESRLRSADFPPVGGSVKKQLLYCAVGIGFHLQILPNGSVGGVHQHTEFCWLRVFALRAGTVGIQGVKSRRYVCVGKDGVVWGSNHFTADCEFWENVEENHYSTYASLSQPHSYLALSHHGKPRRADSVRKEQPCTHFLPRLRS